MKRLSLTACVAGLLALWSTPTFAQGSLIGRAADAERPLEIVYQHVAVQIDDRLARTVVTQVFANNLDEPVEGTYVFALPRDAAVAGFAMWADGKRVAAELKARESAAAEYARAAAAGQTPALLAAAGPNRFQLDVFAIPARGTRRVELTYTEWLDYTAGLVSYTFPARFRQELAQEIGLFDVDLSVRGPAEIAFATSPSYPEARVARVGTRAATLSLSLERLAPTRDVDFVFGVATTPFALDGRAFRPAGSTEDGYFALSLAFNRDPRDEAAREEREVVIALDTSLSMAGGALQRAREAAAEVLLALKPADRVNLVTFDQLLTTFWERSVPAEPENVRDVLGYLDTLRAAGASDLGLLVRSLRTLFDGASPRRILVLLTDGQPTTGDRDAQRLIQYNDFKDLDVNLFVLHVGYPGSRSLLQRLAPSAVYHYVGEGPAGAEATAALVRELTGAALDDVRVRISGPAVSQVLPGGPFVLFEGEQRVLMGRYTPLAGIPALVEVSARLHGAPLRFVQALALPAETDERGAGLAREWAKRRVELLIGDIDQAGGDQAAPELVQEVRGLARAHGLVTRYTSYLARVPAELSLERFKPGDPELYVEAPADAWAVTALLPWGEEIPCTYLPSEGRWMGRFLVPRGTPDGLYRISVVVVTQGGAPQVFSAPYRVDAHAPRMRLDVVAAESELWPGGHVTFRAVPLEHVFEGRSASGGAALPLRERVDVRRIVVRFAGVTRALERTPDGSAWKVRFPLPAGMPTGQSQATLVVTDWAANAFEAEAEVVVLPAAPSPERLAASPRSDR